MNETLKTTDLKSILLEARIKVLEEEESRKKAVIQNEPIKYNNVIKLYDREDEEYKKDLYLNSLYKSDEKMMKTAVKPSKANGFLSIALLMIITLAFEAAFIFTAYTIFK